MQLMEMESNKTTRNTKEDRQISTIISKMINKWQAFVTDLKQGNEASMRSSQLVTKPLKRLRTDHFKRTTSLAHNLEDMLVITQAW